MTNKQIGIFNWCLLGVATAYAVFSAWFLVYAVRDLKAKIVYKVQYDVPIVNITE